jgi:hypothetical protein
VKRDEVCCYAWARALKDDSVCEDHGVPVLAYEADATLEGWYLGSSRVLPPVIRCPWCGQVPQEPQGEA